MLPQGGNAQKDTSPTPSSHGGEADDTSEAGHDLRDNVTSLEEGLTRWALHPKCPSDSNNLANHHQIDLYCLSIDKITLAMKIECTTVSMSE